MDGRQENDCFFFFGKAEAKMRGFFRINITVNLKFLRNNIGWNFFNEMIHFNIVNYVLKAYNI